MKTAALLLASAVITSFGSVAQASICEEAVFASPDVDALKADYTFYVPYIETSVAIIEPTSEMTRKYFAYENLTGLSRERVRFEIQYTAKKFNLGAHDQVYNVMKAALDHQMWLEQFIARIEEFQDRLEYTTTYLGPSRGTYGIQVAVRPSLSDVLWLMDHVVSEKRTAKRLTLDELARRVQAMSKTDAFRITAPPSPDKAHLSRELLNLVIADWRASHWVAR